MSMTPNTPLSMVEVHRDFAEQIVTRAMERATPTELAVRTGHRVQGGTAPANGQYDSTGFVGGFIFNETAMV